MVQTSNGLAGAGSAEEMDTSDSVSRSRIVTFSAVDKNDKDVIGEGDDVEIDSLECDLNLQVTPIVTKTFRQSFSV